MSRQSGITRKTIALALVAPGRAAFDARHLAVRPEAMPAIARFGHDPLVGPSAIAVAEGVHAAMRSGEVAAAPAASSLPSAAPATAAAVAAPPPPSSRAEAERKEEVVVGAAAAATATATVGIEEGSFVAGTAVRDVVVLPRTAVFAGGDVVQLWSLVFENALSVRRGGRGVELRRTRRKNAK